MIKNIRLGMIGMNDGNGHPYSWSAICNGYDPIEMEKCSFPIIPNYLNKQKWPESKIENAPLSFAVSTDARYAASAIFL